MRGEPEIDSSEQKVLYPYQEEAIEKIFQALRDAKPGKNVLFQLPTGGGKTIIFSELARRYLEEFNGKVLILTHRVELSVQTSRALHEAGVKNKIINRDVKELYDPEEFSCYVAMVETLNNRLNDNDRYLGHIGLVIVDEAHYNSFRKIFKFFENSVFLGVTATPLSSNRNLPLNENYSQLIVGESIADLIRNQYLSDATTYTFSVNLRSLKVGPDGDFTVGSLDRLYSLYTMQDRLLSAYEERALNTKTLIFNSGIATSLKVYEMFRNAGYKVRNLDSTYNPKDRQEILEWFRSTPDAILTSVGILTTGFDEPSVETIILNRATRSLTLYHQMIGRGSRITPRKKHFNIIDLGNNVQRLGLWQDFVNWQDIFQFPEKYFDRINQRDEDAVKDYQYTRPQYLEAHFPNNTEEDDFHMRDAVKRAVADGRKPNSAIDASLFNHERQVLKNASNLADALELVQLLDDEIEYRLRLYCNSLQKATENYFQWLKETYVRKLIHRLRTQLM